MLKYIYSLVLYLVSLTCFSEEFTLGKDYVQVKNLNALENHSGKVGVTEFFSFGCPWCNHLEPGLAKWLAQQQGNITFRKVPVLFKKDWDFYAKAYYAAEALSLNSTMNPALFKAILDEKRPLNSNQAMIDFFIQQGVEPATAKSAFTSSPSIDLSLKTSENLMAGYQINAVPAFVVNDEFKTDLQMAKSEERLFAILDFLITQSKKHA
jgi:protein dithiol oxidoreductase (disulfide-forming)